MDEKISCIIVDDEPAALQLMERYAQKTPFLDLKAALNNGIEVLQFLQQHEAPSLLFLDIQMPELSGIALSRLLPAESKVIFTTAFEQYAIEGYKVNALDYLLKPIDYTEFLTAALKAKDWFQQQTILKSNVTGNIHTNDFLFIRSEYKQLKIKISDIIYIEGFKDYAKIFIASEKHPILSLISLKKLEEELPPEKFMRIHRSFIVALNKIDHIERNQIIISNQRITIAEQYRPAFNDFVNKNAIG